MPSSPKEIKLYLIITAIIVVLLFILTIIITKTNILNKLISNIKICCNISDIVISSNNSNYYYNIVKKYKNKDNNNCPICLDVLTNNLIQLKKCKHILHKECLDVCFEHNINKCPICRIFIGNHINNTNNIFYHYNVVNSDGDIILNINNRNPNNSITSNSYISMV